MIVNIHARTINYRHINELLTYVSDFKSIHRMKEFEIDILDLCKIHDTVITEQDILRYETYNDGDTLRADYDVTLHDLNGRPLPAEVCLEFSITGYDYETDTFEEATYEGIHEIRIWEEKTLEIFC